MYIEDKEVFETWKKAIEDMEKAYMKMKELGASTDMCREILPHSTAAEYTMTANIREWKHILELRTTNHVHPAIRQVLIPLLLLFKEQMPEIFGDIEYDKEFRNHISPTTVCKPFPDIFAFFSFFVCTVIQHISFNSIQYHSKVYKTLRIHKRNC